MEKVLFISTMSPFHFNSGSQQRTNLIYKALTEIYSVDVLLFTYEYEGFNPDNYRIKNETIKILNFNNETKRKYSFYEQGAVFPQSNYFSDETNKLTKNNNYKFIFVRYAEMVYQCGLENHSNLIVDIDDMPSDKFYSRFKSLSWGRKKINYLVKTVLSEFLIKRLARSAYHSFVSNPDQIISAKTTYLPNIPFPFYEKTIVSTKKFEETEESILFVGLMGYYPNYLGMDIFIENVWPGINKAKPNLKLKIAGKDLPLEYEKKWRSFQNIEYMGFVEDLFTEYDNCRVVIIPIYHGAGTNIKILEAMKAKKAIVASGFSTRGFDKLLKHNENILVSNSYSEFSKNVLELVSNKDLNEKLASKAFEDIQQSFSYDNFKEIVQKSINQ